MKDSDLIGLLLPLAVGVAAVICTCLIHALPLSLVVKLVSRERRLHRAGASFWLNHGMVAVVVLLALLAHLAEIAFWAALYMICGEFSNFRKAYYHSAVNYTSLGYGDIIMSPTWRLLGPIESANGMLLFGLSTAMIFAVILWLVGCRYTNLGE